MAAILQKALINLLMDESIPIFYIDESCKNEGYSEAEIFECTIHLYDKPFCFCIGAKKELARLSDIVPLAYSIADQINSAVVTHFSEKGQEVSCRKGCFLCCKYLVALSLPEIFYMQNNLANINVNYLNQVLKSCFNAAQKILDINLLEKHNINQNFNLSQLSNWYSELNLLCPFSSNGSCSIYSQRPLACREHMVTSSPKFCENMSMDAPEIVPMPISILEALGLLAADLEETTMEATILPLALICRNAYIEHSNRRWPTTLIVERFIHVLNTMSQKAIQNPTTVC